MRRVAGFAGLALAVGFLVLAVASARDVARFDVASLASRTPDRTELMRQREREAMRDHRPYSTDVRTVPYDRISPLLRRAVLIAEDDAFFSHGGLDWNELKASARANLRKKRWARGGSTITQQLAKNLFLGTERTLTRKLREAFLAMRLEGALSKRRIFELYLNRIEWGSGIFGIEAAARRYFGTSSGDLNPRQALLLAAVIINPVRYSVLAPEPRIERRVRMIANRMRRRGYLSEAEYHQAIGDNLFFFGAAPDSTALDSAAGVTPAESPGSVAPESLESPPAADSTPPG